MKKKFIYFWKVLFLEAKDALCTWLRATFAEVKVVIRQIILRQPAVILLVLTLLLLVVLKTQKVFSQPTSMDLYHFSGTRGAVTGIVIEHPDPRKSGCVYVIQTETFQPFEEEREMVSIQGKLLLHVTRSTSPIAVPGDRLRFYGQVQTPPSARVPGSFDYARYLENHGIFSLMYTSSSSIRNLGLAGGSRLARMGWAMKQNVLHIFEHHLEEKPRVVLAGLVLGIRPRFHPDIKKIFTNTGTMHVLVASGSNVAFVMGLWIFLGRGFRISHRGLMMSALVPLWFYVWMVGFDPPIARAGVMASVGLAAYALRRETSPFHAIVVAALILLWSSPRTLFDVGFQMSFLSVFGLIYFFPQWADSGGEPALKISALAGLLWATMTAQLWLLPISANVFHRWALVGPLANMFVLPLAALGWPLGVLTLSCHALVEIFPRLQGIGELIFYVINMFLLGFIQLVQFFSDHLGKNIWLQSFSALTITGFYLVLVTMVKLKNSRCAQLGFGLGVLFVLVGFWQMKKSRSSVSSARVLWCDVGRNLATILQTQENETVVLLPGGEDRFDATERILLPFLTEQGIGSVNVLISRERTPTNNSFSENFFEEGNVDLNYSEEKFKTFLGRKIRIQIFPSDEIQIEDKALLVRYRDSSLLIAQFLSLELQKELVESQIAQLDLIQTRFSPKLLWNQNFLKKFKPRIVVEEGICSEKTPCQSPWVDVPMLIPQKKGWGMWSLTPAEKENP